MRTSLKHRVGEQIPAFINATISHLRPFANKVVGFVLPETCAGCDMSGSWMCDYCREELLDVLLLEKCSRCGSPRMVSASQRCIRCSHWQAPRFNVRSRYVFNGPARSAVHLVKYSGQWARAEWIAEQLHVLLPNSRKHAVLSPVPLAKKRYKRRGFNQAHKIAGYLSEQSGIPTSNSLVRVRETPTQVGLTASERYRNVQAAFECVDDVRDQEILLVDDVMTTGATLDSCARALIQAGARSVTGLTFAIDAPQFNDRAK